MKLIIAITLFMAAAHALPQDKAPVLPKDPEVTKDEEEAGVIFTDPEKEAEAEKNLENAKEHLHNDSLEQEKLYDFDALSDDEFLKEKTGLIENGVQDRIKIVAPGTGRIDPSPEEMLDQRSEDYFEKFKSGSYPASYDSTAKGQVTSVKNQGKCGSCVGYSTVTSIETCMMKAGSPKKASEIDLSEQHFVDCGYTKKYSAGCGGAPTHAYHKFVAKEDGGELPSETDYPYIGEKTIASGYKCKSASKYQTGAKVANSYWTYNCDEEMMARLIAAHGSVTTTVLSNQPAFRNYAKGIVDQCAPDSVKRLDHAIVAVGYGEENGVKFWKIKNSWGNWWGDKGFAKIKRGAGNMCGLAKECAVSVCTKTGGSSPTPPAPVTKSCDLSPFAKKYYNGYVWNTNITVEGHEFSCTNNVCTNTNNAGPTVCKLLCGSDTC